MDALLGFVIAVSFGYFIVINLQYTVLTVVSFLGTRTRVRQAALSELDAVVASSLTPPVSVIIPACNEERVITDSVAAALRLRYPEYQVIIVNDGSTDGTLARLEEEFALQRADLQYRATLATEPVRRVLQSQRDPRLFVLDKENGGKADALNAGINFARYRYVCNTDADTVFEPDALVRAIRPVLEDPQRLVAVGGQVRVGNGLVVENGAIVSRRLTLRLLPALQVIEYLRTFLANRIGWSKLNAMLLISGAFGLWRRDILVAVGGFSRRMTGEDLELTLRLHRVLRKRGMDFRVVSLPDPVCWTEAPSDLRSFIRQRNRWHRVLLESFAEHREMMLNPFFGFAGLLGMPYYLFFEILGPFLEALSYLVMGGLFATGHLAGTTFGLFLLCSVGYTTVLNLFALVIEELHYETYRCGELIWLAFAGLLDNLGYRQFTMGIRVIATFDWLGRVRTWGRIERHGL